MPFAHRIVPFVQATCFLKPSSVPSLSSDKTLEASFAWVQESPVQSHVAYFLDSNERRSTPSQTASRRTRGATFLAVVVEIVVLFVVFARHLPKSAAHVQSVATTCTFEHLHLLEAIELVFRLERRKALYEFSKDDGADLATLLGG